MRLDRALRVVGAVLFTGCLAVTAGPAAAQGQATVTGTVTAATVTGRVTAAADAAPQIGATVTVDGAGASALTDEGGRYTLALPPGTHTIRVSAYGQVPAERTVTVQAGVPQAIDFQLVADPRLGETIVVVGSRTPRTQLETSVPVDVITDEVIAESSQTETNQLLNTIAPSFNAAHLSVVDGTDHIDPASLRGLGPEHVLVLVNGKRRQQSALVNFYNGGTVGVDMNAIPTSAIARIEVLRDGAASQYGSDAIAGVINVVLKDNVDQLQAYALSGITASGDGEQFKVGANGGTKLGERGFVNLTGEFLMRGRTNRAEPWPEDIYPGIEGREATDAEIARRGLTRDDFNMSVGQAGATVGTGFLNAGYRLSEAVELYGHGGYTYRKGKASGFYRYPNEEERVDLTLYPNGFLPEINPTMNAWSATGGARADLAGWRGDLSLTHGGDSFHFFVENSLNASLGAMSPTEFDAGELAFTQTTANLDLVRPVGLPFMDSLNFVLGTEVRYETYGITAGQRESYELGTATTMDGEPKAPGAQVFPGFQPSDETDADRSSVAAYLGAESRPNDRTNLDVGGRFERYSDFGNTVIGKVAGRFAPLKTEENEVALRGAVSTGFRAPALQQIWYSTIATNFINDPVTSELTPSEILVSPNQSAVTEAFGIPRLKEETSINVSAGFTARLLRDLSLSADFYRVQIDDRVVLSGLFSGDDPVIGAPVSAILGQFPGVVAAQFFVNAVDTTTNGLDVVVDHGLALGRGRLNSSASANFTYTLVEEVKVPDSVADNFDVGEEGPERVRDIFLGRDGVNRLQDLLPHIKGTLGLRYAIGPLTTAARANYFGKTRWRNPVDPALDERFGAEVTLDADIGYQLGDLRLGVGGNNLLNNFPDEMKREGNRYFGTFLYGPTTPYGIEGAFYYVKLEYVL